MVFPAIDWVGLLSERCGWARLFVRLEYQVSSWERVFSGELERNKYDLGTGGHL
jgi:hypothetical protein